jgi:hypothetical protein
MSQKNKGRKLKAIETKNIEKFVIAMNRKKIPTLTAKKFLISSGEILYEVYSAIKRSMKL